MTQVFQGILPTIVGLQEQESWQEIILGKSD